MMIELTDAELFEAVEQNNVSKICTLLDEVGLKRNCERFRYDPTTWQVIQLALTTASAMAFIGKLSDELAEELVVRTAPCCELYQLLRTVAIAAEIKTDNYDAVPKYILDYIASGSFLDNSVMQRIEKLDADAIKALIDWTLSDKSPSSIFIVFNRPFLSCIRRRAVVPVANLLAFMAGTLREPLVDPVSALARLFN